MANSGPIKDYVRFVASLSEENFGLPETVLEILKNADSKDVVEFSYLTTRAYSNKHIYVLDTCVIENDNSQQITIKRIEREQSQIIYSVSIKTIR